MDFPLEAVTAIVPSPRIGVEVVPSAKTTCLEPFQGLNVWKRDLSLMSVCDAPESMSIIHVC